MTEDVFPKGKLAALDPAEYWEAQASMWHENYKEALEHEGPARRFREVLEQIANGRYTAERVRQMAIKALAREIK
jgi:hypothetical protein